MSAVVHVVAAVIRRDDGAILIAKRPGNVHQGGLWEFPGGKVEASESVSQALSRELEEELGIHIKAGSPGNHPLIQVYHDYGDKRVFLDVWSVQEYSGEPYGREGQPVEWVAPEQLSTYAFPAANLPIVQAARLPERYLITGNFDSPEDFEQRLNRALQQGIRLVQLRAKDLPETELEPLARRALSLCRSAGAKLLVNGTPALARKVGADGVHLTGPALEQCLERPLPDDYLVAASCHGLECLARAQRIGADFVVLSPVNETASHPDVPGIGWGRFKEWVKEARVPVFALGGLDNKDLPEAREHGAQGIAAIRAWWPG